jgi:hypothetical protein
VKFRLVELLRHNELLWRLLVTAEPLADRRPTVVYKVPAAFVFHNWVFILAVQGSRVSDE